MTFTGIEGAVPGWHRGKQFDDFKAVLSMVYNGYLIDDGHVPKFRMEDIKSFLGSGFHRFIDCRFHPINVVKNAFAAIIDNTWDKNAEPSEDEVQHGGQLPWETFFKMIEPSFGSIREDDLLAILKRAVVIIAGYRAVYVRLPSESKDGPVIMYTDEDVAQDWFHRENMWSYIQWQKGTTAWGIGGPCHWI